MLPISLVVFGLREIDLFSESLHLHCMVSRLDFEQLGNHTCGYPHRTASLSLDEYLGLSRMLSSMKMRLET